jgi:predicted esterase
MTLCGLVLATILTAQDKTSESGLTYRLMKPQSPTGRKTPLMLFLHGTGGNRGLFGGWASEANRRGYLVCLPWSTGNGGYGDNLKRWDKVDHPKIVGLVQELIKNENVDPRRVYVGGYSNGAGNTSAVGLANPEIFSGILVIGGWYAGLPYGKKLDEARKMGVYILHGDKDKSVPVDGAREMERALKGAGFSNVVYKEFPGRGHDLFEEEIKKFYDWLPQFYKRVPPGSNATLPWSSGTPAELPEKKVALLYFYSAADDRSPVADYFEMELFIDPSVVRAAAEVVCWKLDRDQGGSALANELKVKGPSILLVDSTKKVLASWTAPAPAASFVQKIQSLAKRAASKR